MYDPWTGTKGGGLLERMAVWAEGGKGRKMGQV